MPPVEPIAHLPSETLWTVTDVARFFGCTARHVKNLQVGGLPYFYLGRLVRFDPTEVRHYLTLNRRIAATKVRREARRPAPPPVEPKPAPQPAAVPVCYF